MDKVQKRSNPKYVKSIIEKTNTDPQRKNRREQTVKRNIKKIMPNSNSNFNNVTHNFFSLYKIYFMWVK
jgi:hypothetical protein